MNSVLNRKKRNGMATVELAICMPILVLLVMGTTELNSAIFLKQTLTSAAHEGALTGLRMNATEQEILDRVDQVLSTRTVGEYSVNVETASAVPFDSLGHGQTFTVVVQSGPIRALSVISLGSVDARITAMKN